MKAARPSLVPAFKLAATLSVVGAIVGEISAGIRGGLGRVILDYAGRYTTGPEKLYAAYDAASAPAPGRGGRVELYNLYHLLNHANLFGGNYVAQAQARIRQLI